MVRLTACESDIEKVNYMNGVVEMSTLDFMEIEKLAVLAKSGNEEAKGELIKQFKPYLFSISSDIQVHGYGIEEKVKVCMDILEKCLELYKPEKHRFAAYASVGIKSFMKCLEKNYGERDNSKENLLHFLTDSLEDIIEDKCLYFVDKLSECSFSFKLKEVLVNLQEEEAELIEYIYLDGNSIKDYADKKGISCHDAIKFRNKSLKELRKIIDQD